jgi:NAD(P)-dependent dehydrogenase (short-subunit alcohol dehydrogenase family)
MATPKTSMRGFPDRSLTIQPVPLESLDLRGRRLIIVGGTDGLGRAIGRVAISRGAEVTVVGRTFRDPGVTGLTFVQADLSSMKEATRLGRELAVESADVLLLTTGIIAAKRREVTSEGLERDMAISYLSRMAVLRGVTSRLGAARPAGTGPARIFVMGFPGTGNLGNLDDLTGERSYDAMAVHTNTVAGNEALVLDGARRSPGVHFFGLNPGLIKTKIRANMLGDGSLLHRAVEFLIGVVMPSADAYARRIVPLLFAKEIDTRTGLMFGGKASPILPTEGMTEAHVAQLIDTSEKLLEGALKR